MSNKNNLEVKVAVSLDTTSIQTQLNELESRLSKLEATVNVGANTDEAEKKVESLSKKLENIGSTMTTAGSALENIFGGVTDFATDSIKIYAEFEQVMANIKATTGLTADEVKTLTKTAEELATTTQYSNTEVAQAMLALAKGGMDVQQIMGAIPSVLNLATVSQGDLADSADYTTKILNSFGLASKDVGEMTKNTARVVDVLAEAANKSTLDVGTLATYLGNCSGTGELLGYTIEDVCAVLMTLSDNGLQAGKATIALRNIMMTMAGGELKLCAQGMEDVVIKTQKADGTMKSLQDILLECNGAFGNMTEAQQIQAATSLVGKTNAEAFVKAVNNANGQIQENTQALYDASGAAQEYNDTIMDTPEGNFLILQSNIDNLKKSIGEGLTPVVSTCVEYLTKLVEFISGLDPKLVSIIVGAGAILGLLGAILTPLGLVVFSLGQLGGVISQVWEATGFLRTGLKLLTGSLGGFAWLIPVVVGAVALGAYEVIKHWDEIKQSFGDFTEWLGEKINDIKEWFGELFKSLKGVWDKIVDIFHWGDINTDLGDFIKEIKGQWSECFKWIGNIFDRFKDGFSWDKVKQTTGEFLEGIGYNFENTFKNIKNAFKVVEDVFHLDGLTEAVIGTAKSIGEKLGANIDLDSAEEKFNLLYERIKYGWEQSFTWMGNVFDRFKDGFSWDKVKATTAEFLDGLQINTSKTFDNIATAVSGLGDLTGTQDLAFGIVKGLTSVENFVGVWGTNLEEQFGECFKWIGNVFDRFKDGFSWDDVKQTTGEFLEGTKINFGNVFKNIRESLNAGGWNLGWDNLGDSIFRPLDDIKGQWDECLSWMGRKKDEFEDGITWEKIKTTAQEALDGVSFNTEALDKTIEDTKLSLSEIFQTDKIQQKWNDFKLWIGNLDIKQAFSDKWSEFTTWLGELDIVKFAEQKWGEFKTWFGSLSFVQTVTKKWDEVKTWAEGISITGFAQKKWDEFKTWFGSLSFVQAISKSWNEFTKWLEEQCGKLTKPFKDFWDGIKGVFEEIGGFWHDVIAPWIEPFQEFFNKVGSIFGSIWDSVKETANNKWDEIKESIERKWNETWEGIKQTFAPLINWFTDTWRQIKEGFSHIWDVIKDIAIQAWEGIKAPFVNAGNWFGEKWNEVKESIEKKWDEIKESIERKWNETWEGIKQTFAPLINWFTDTWDQISGGFSRAGDVIIDLAGQAWEGIKEPFINAGNWWEENVSTPIKQGWSDAKEAISKKWGEWKEGFLTDNNEAAKNFGDWVDGMPTDWQGCVDYIGKAWNDTTDGIKTKLEDTGRAIVQKWEDIKTGIGDKVNEIKTSVVNKWEEIKTGVANKANDIKTSVTEAFNKLLQPIKDVKEHLEKFLGKLSEIKVPNPLNAIKSAFDGVKNAIKEAKEWLDKFNLTSVKDKTVNLVKNIFTNTQEESLDEPVSTQAISTEGVEPVPVNNTRTVFSMEELRGSIGVSSVIGENLVGGAMQGLNAALGELNSNIATMNSLLGGLKDPSSSARNTNVTFNNTITQNTTKETDIDELLESVEARQKYQLRKLGVFDK